MTGGPTRWSASPDVSWGHDGRAGAVRSDPHRLDGCRGIPGAGSRDPRAARRRAGAQARVAERRDRAPVRGRSGPARQPDPRAHRRGRARLHDDVRTVRRRTRPASARACAGRGEHQLCRERRGGGSSTPDGCRRSWRRHRTSTRRRCGHAAGGARGAVLARAPPDTEGWTLLEAALKADGRGVAVDLAEVQIGAIGTGGLAGSRAVRIPGRVDAADAGVIAGPAGFVLSAAMVPAAGERHPS